MNKKMTLFLFISFLIVLAGCSNNAHNSEGILFETTALKAIEYESLDELILASDLIVEARVLENKEVIEDPSYPRRTISTLSIEDILYAKNDVSSKEITLIEGGDYRYHLDIVKNGETHILFLMKINDVPDELITLSKASEAELERLYVAVDQWQGKFNITENDTTYFFAEKDEVKPYQEELASLPHQEMKEKIQEAIEKVH